jgi:hypothetical protein
MRSGDKSILVCRHIILGMTCPCVIDPMCSPYPSPRRGALRARSMLRCTDALRRRRSAPHRQRPFLSLVIGRACRRSQCKLAQSLVQKIVGFVQKITCLKKSTVISVRVFCRCNRRNQLRKRLLMGQVSRWPIDRDVVKRRCRWRCSSPHSLSAR